MQSIERSLPKRANQHGPLVALFVIALGAAACAPIPVEDQEQAVALVDEEKPLSSDCEKDIDTALGGVVSTTLAKAVCSRNFVPDVGPVRLLIRVRAEGALAQRDGPFDKNSVSDIREAYEKGKEEIARIESSASTVFNDSLVPVLPAFARAAGCPAPSMVTQLGPFFSIQYANMEALSESVIEIARAQKSNAAVDGRDLTLPVSFMGLSAPVPDDNSLVTAKRKTGSDSVRAAMKQSGVLPLYEAGNKGAHTSVLIVENKEINRPASCFSSNWLMRCSPTSKKIRPTHMTRTLAMFGVKEVDPQDDAKCIERSEPFGYAAQAQVMAANTPPTETMDYVTASRWAHSLGRVFSVVNEAEHARVCQRHGLSDRDIVHDWAAVHYPWPTIVVPAGRPTWPSSKVSNCARIHNNYVNSRAFNTLAVADVTIRATPMESVRVSIDSSTINPKDTDRPGSKNNRELPEISAPGSDHLELIGQHGFAATSASTAVAGAISTLLISEAPELAIQPEAVRAILMAGAADQLADGKIWYKVAMDWREDGGDGVGQINAQRSMMAARANCAGAIDLADGIVRCTSNLSSAFGYDKGTLKNCGNGLSNCLPRTWEIEIPQQNLQNYTGLRAVFVWNSRVDKSASREDQSVLDADLSLSIDCPGGTSRNDVSKTALNNYEVVECKYSGGKYKITVDGDVVSGIGNANSFRSYYGIAWAAY